MKLFTSYNRILAGITLSGLLVIGFLFHKTLEQYINRQIEDHLYEELLEVKDFAHVKNIVPTPDGFDDIILAYKRLQKIDDKRHLFADTNFYNPKKKHHESGRYLKTQVLLNGEPYEVKIIASKFETQEQIKSIVLIILPPVLILLMILWVVNRFLIRKMWLPFKALLRNIKAFNVNKEDLFKSIDTNIEEFKELNDAMVEVTLKIKSDYQEIKLFTENASHEMMTPLAIINSKLDTMLQSNSLVKEDSEILEDLYRATSKLTKLHQSLLLLVKIDNNQLQNKELINLETLINDKIIYFHELIIERNLKLTANLNKSIIYANRSLIDMIVNNLFSNAIRHNFDGGTIEIKLQQNNLQFSNSSSQTQHDPEKIFNRFYKDNASDGTGLGLAILKQVCVRQNYSLHYSYQQGLHIFTIGFDTIHPE